MLTPAYILRLLIKVPLSASERVILGDDAPDRGPFRKHGSIRRMTASPTEPQRRPRIRSSALTKCRANLSGHSVVFATPLPRGRFSKDRPPPLAHSDQSHSALH